MMRLRVTFLVFVFASTCAYSGTLAPEVECWIQVGDGMRETWNPTADVGSEPGTWDYDGMWSGMAWELTLDSTAEEDPSISAVVGITNPSAAIQTYTFTYILPVSPLSDPTVHGGSSIVTLLDADFDSSATMGIDASSGDELYWGLIDMMPVLKMLPPVGSGQNALPLVVTTQGGFISTANSLGLPGPTLPSGDVTMSIGIQHKFTLTPGDQATLNSNFIVTPEPLTLTMLALGWVLVRRRPR